MQSNPFEKVNTLLGYREEIWLGIGEQFRDGQIDREAFLEKMRDAEDEAEYMTLDKIYDAAEEWLAQRRAASMEEFEEAARHCAGIVNRDGDPCPFMDRLMERFLSRFYDQVR